MKKITKDYFEGSTVALVGYSSKKESFSRMVMKEFVKQGVKAYPVNPNDADYDIKVYRSLEDIPEKVDIAYVLTSKVNSGNALETVANAGIKKALVQSAKLVEEETVKMCESKGVELAAGCPMMSVGKGLHRFHGFLAGVR